MIWNPHYRCLHQTAKLLNLVQITTMIPSFPFKVSLQTAEGSRCWLGGGRLKGVLPACVLCSLILLLSVPDGAPSLIKGNPEDQRKSPLMNELRWKREKQAPLKCVYRNTIGKKEAVFCVAFKNIIILEENHHIFEDFLWKKEKKINKHLQRKCNYGT